MIPDVVLRERVVLENLREQYEGRGFRFIPHPPRDAIPFDLGDYRPDAVAIGRNGGAIFAVKVARRPAAAPEDLTDVQRQVSEHPGWQFLVVYAGARPDADLELPRPTQPELRQALIDVTRLADAGHHRAAFLLGWAILEALARLVDEAGDGAATGPYAPVQTVELLAMAGYLDGDAARHLRDLARLRNRVAHGDLGAAVTSRDAADVLRQARGIHAVIPTEETGQRPATPRHA